MSRIHTLDTLTANSIAAGEVVESPASVIKELCENALDAGASVITIEADQGGIDRMMVMDNGCGMDPEDARRAFWPHATSKLNHIDDLDSLQTMGFRGEALASISAVSRIRLVTRQAEAEAGTLLELEGGEEKDFRSIGAPVGTQITVANLFFNTPARFKFLKKNTTEAGKITDTVQRLALARPDVSFQLRHNGKPVLHTPGNNDLLSTIFAIFGKNIAQDLIQLPDSKPDDGIPVFVSGYVGQPGSARNSRAHQLLFVNDRYVRCPTLTKALDEAYRGRLMKGKYPFAMISVHLPQHLVDINVHPQKLEVRFWNTGVVFTAVLRAIREALEEHVLPPGEYESLPVSDSGVGVAPAREGLGIDAYRMPTEEDHPLPEIGAEEKARTSHQAAAPATSSWKYSPAERGEAKRGKLQNHNFWQSLAEHTPSGDTYKSGASYGAAAQVEGRGLPQPPSPPVAPDEDRSATTSLQPEEARPVQPTGPEGVARRLSKLPVIGQAFHTYLILQDSECLWLVDQHAAHEKVLFERFYKEFRANKPRVQPLMAPLTVNLDSLQYTQIQEQKEKLALLGYEIEDFGDRSVLLRAVPSSLEVQDPVPSFLAVLESLVENEQTPTEGWAEREGYDILAEAACKAAIKGNDPLAPEEIHGLLEELETLDQPYNCPHGRPIVIRLSRYELEKRFKRIL